MIFNNLKRIVNLPYGIINTIKQSFSTTQKRLENNPEKYYSLGKRKPFSEMYNGKMYNFSLSKNIWLPPVMHKNVGARQNMYKPSAEKRIKKYGLTTRLQTRGGKQILWRKILKGPNGWVSLYAGP
jgi:ribosomal protein L34